MSVGKAFVGLGVLGLGILSAIWWIVKIISCILLATYVSTYVGFNGWLWWALTIIVYCVLCKIAFYGNSNQSYNEIVDKYNKWAIDE